MKNVTLCPDGKYRWTYEMKILRNPSIFLLVWKILFFVILGIFCFVIIFDIAEWGFKPDRMLETAKFLGYFMIGMTVLTVLAYLLYAAIMGGKYIVDFTLDENGVIHSQTPSQAKKAKKIGALAAAAGAMAGRPSAAGAGLAATRTVMSTDFSRVKSVKAFRRRNLIKVNQTLSKNQVYVCDEDFDFVFEYIVSHVPETTKIKN